jgi:hypothetical protein
MKPNSESTVLALSNLIELGARGAVEIAGRDVANTIEGRAATLPAMRELIAERLRVRMANRLIGLPTK